MGRGGRGVAGRSGKLAEYCNSHGGEPAERIGEFDRARRHYVAFTRARHLLVLTASGELQNRFIPIWEGASQWPEVDREALARQRFEEPAEEGHAVVEEIGHLDRLVIRLLPSGPVG